MPIPGSGSSCNSISVCKHSTREGETGQEGQELAVADVFQIETASHTTDSALRARLGRSCWSRLRTFSSSPSMNIKESQILNGEMPTHGPAIGGSMKQAEEDRHQEHFKTDHLLTNLKGHTI